MRFTTDLWGIQSLVHDLWFDVEAIRHDAVSLQFEMDLGWKKRGRPYRDALFKVSEVKKVTIADHAGIQFYDLVDIRLGPSSIQLHGGAPLEITLEVGNGWTIAVLHPGEQSNEPK